MTHVYNEQEVELEISLSYATQLFVDLDYTVEDAAAEAGVTVYDLETHLVGIGEL